MCTPSSFREEDRAVLYQWVREYSFGLLITIGDDGLPVATHLPFLLETNGEQVTLRAHIARANPQWRGFESGREVLCVFSGPHAYVSPSWYATHPSVPTWNYVAVHAYGVPRIVEGNALTELLAETTAQFENGFAEPWTMASLSDEYLRHMENAIVGLEIPIARLEGKRKMSQNRSAIDQAQVRVALSQSDREADRETARLMEQH